jgi:hypothetical protein
MLKKLIKRVTKQHTGQVISLGGEALTSPLGEGSTVINFIIVL